MKEREFPLPILVKKYNGNDWDYVEFKGPIRPCYKCKYRKFEGGSWCTFGKDIKVINVITGRTEDLFDSLMRCQDQRYSNHPQACGLEGKYFEPSLNKEKL